MKYLVIAAFIISSVLSAPAPQDFADQPAQNFAANSVQVVRYFFNWLDDDQGYQYT